MRQHDFLLLARHDPASRIIRRIQQDCASVRRQGVQQLLQIEFPCLAELQGHAYYFGAEDFRDFGDIRPQRRYRHHPVTRVDDQLRQHHQCRYAGGSDRYPAGVYRLVQSG